jgi:hypothetical protein
MTSRDEQLSTRVGSGAVHVMLANFSHEETELPRAVIGIAEEFSENLVATINSITRTG